MRTAIELRLLIDASDDLKLRSGRYRLCLARRVNGQFSVAWQATSEFLADSLFELSSRYRVFAEADFAVGHEFTTRSFPAGAELGQKLEFDEAGTFLNPESGEDQETIVIENRFPGVRFLLEEAAGDGVAPSEFLLVHASADETPAHQVFQLAPEPTVLVWFSREQEVGEPIATLPANAVTVDFSDEAYQVREFSGGAWRLPE